MITLTLKTSYNLFDKPKLFVDIVATNPWYARRLMERSSSIVLDYELARRIIWMFPKGTNRDVDFLLELNEKRLSERNNIADERIGMRKYQVLGCDGVRIKFNHSKYSEL